MKVTTAAIAIMHHISLLTTGTATQDFSTIKANAYTYSISLSKFPEDIYLIWVQ